MTGRRVFIMPDVRVVFEDPDMEMLPVIRRFEPGFRIESTPPPETFVPGLKKVSDMSSRGSEVYKSLERCELCGWRCRINRFKEAGRCGLRESAYISEPFIHIGEEAVFNPAINIKLFGCPMRCVYCQASGHLNVLNGMEEGLRLNSMIWGKINLSGAVSLEFVGGDPIGSLPAILELLSSAPPAFNLPVVWDDCLYGTEMAYRILDGVVDVYLPDMRYGNNECAKRLSGVEGYWDIARAALKVIVGQEARIIVRLLVLPGHFDCCLKRIVEWLSRFKHRLWVSPMSQYIPRNEALQFPDINRLPTGQEIEQVQRLIKSKGLRDVNKSPEQFWKQGE